MAKRDEKGYIHYSPEELAQIPSYEERTDGQGTLGLPLPGATLGAVTGGVAGSAAGPAGTLAGAAAGGLVGNQLDQATQGGTQGKRA